MSAEFDNRAKVLADEVITAREEREIAKRIALTLIDMLEKILAGELVPVRGADSILLKSYRGTLENSRQVAFEQHDTILRLQNQVDALLQLNTYQRRAHEWATECFGEHDANHKPQRTHRFLEEALELGQAAGVPVEDVLMLVEYVYTRPAGELAQEVGGVMNTLAVFCEAHRISMKGAAETELARCWEKFDVIRAKQAAKKDNSALPGYVEPRENRVLSGCAVRAAIQQYYSGKPD